MHLLRSCTHSLPHQLLRMLILGFAPTAVLLTMFFPASDMRRRIKHSFAMQTANKSIPQLVNWQQELNAIFESQPPLHGLDTQTLQRQFPTLKKCAANHSRRYQNSIDGMMRRYIPVVNTSHWKLHSPAGRTFTIQHVQAVAQATLQPGFLVPNIAHFVLPFGDSNLQFHHMVSLLSCLHVMKPHRVMLWYSPGKLPTGQWWNRVRRNLSESEWEEKVIMAQRPVPTSVYTVPVHGKEHQSDVMRMEAVLVFGGVYMDIDVLVLKPLEPLRKYSFTIGREVSYGLCNGVFLSAPCGTFLAMWHTAYQVLNDTEWGSHSVKLPNTLQKSFPDLCHVEEESMDRPNWTSEEMKWIYGIGQQHKWDWRSKNYVMHLWFRKYNKQHDLVNIRSLNSTFGELCRLILFGTRWSIKS